jgi:hypothetical protein
MSSAEDPEGREHVGDEYVTYNRRRERRPRPDFPPFPPSSEEEEEAHREAERRAEHEASMRQRGCWETDMRDQRAVARPPWTRGNLHAGTQQSGSQSAGHDSVLGTDG